MFDLKAEGASGTVLADPPAQAPAPVQDWTPTAQQQAILDAVGSTAAHIAVNAVAGASKTTTALKAAGLAGPNCGFVAFNKSIADELKARLWGNAPNARASTMHSLGYRLLANKFPGIELDERKVQRHFLEHYPEMHEEGKGRWAGRFFPVNDYSCVPEIVSVCKSQLLSPAAALDRRAIVHALDSQGVELPEHDALEECLDAVGQLLETTLADSDTCDFNDMVWMPVALDIVQPQFATLFVDESQDLNAAQQELVMRSGERFVIIGDPAQAIYGFAGADIRSFATLVGRLGSGAASLPLSMSFRCPSTHGSLARHLVPHFETRPGAAEGEIIEAGPAKAIKAMRPGDMVICRANAPLISLAYELIREGQSVLVRGRKIGEGLTSLVKRLRARDLDDLGDKLDGWEQRQLRKLAGRDAQAGRGQVRDKAECLRCLIEAADTVEDLLAKIDQLFADHDPASRIVLSSIHRAKGLERDRIFIWEPGMMPMSQDQQERNILYVALTRARQSLWLVDGRIQRRHRAHEWLAMIAAGASKRDLVVRKFEDGEE